MGKNLTGRFFLPTIQASTKRGNAMKRAAYLLVGLNLLLAVCCATVPADELTLFKTSTRAKTIDDKAAIENWWEGLHGNSKVRIESIEKRKSLKDFEVDIGDRSRPHWVNVESWMKELGDGAYPVTAKVGPTDGKKPLPMLFVMKDGAVIYQKHAFREAR
jgi:hypothetical protein